MATIEFKKPRIHLEWEGGDIDNRLKFIIYSLAGYMRTRDFHGVRITQIIRTEEENREVGGVANSKHLTGEGIDVNPPRNFPKASWFKWRMLAKMYINKHLEGVDAVIHGAGSNEHVHVEIDVKPPEVDVRLI